MNVNKLHFPLALIAALCLHSTASAEKAPLSAEELVQEADAIVIATIEEIRIQSEPATFDRAFGNSDWGIYLTFKVQSVEQGAVAGESLEARCFRTRTRRSLGEFATPSGHHPIPETGTLVKAFLQQRNGSWHVVLPNGLQPMEGALSDANAVTRLWSRRYTYLLPLEGWLLLLVVGLPILICIRLLKRRKLSAAPEKSQISGDK